MAFKEFHPAYSLCSTPGGGRGVCNTPGDVQYTGGIIDYTGGVQYTGGYHEYTEIPWWVWGISWVHWGMFSLLGFSYKFYCFPNDLPPHLSWYPPIVLMLSPSVIRISPVYWTSPVVLETPSVLHRHCAGWIFQNLQIEKKAVLIGLNL